MQERRKGQCGVQAGNPDPWEGKKGAYINKADKENRGCGREHPREDPPLCPNHRQHERMLFVLALSDGLSLPMSTSVKWAQ